MAPFLTACFLIILVAVKVNAEREVIGDRIKDRLAIQALFHDYCHAVDTRDWEMLRDLYTPDAYLEYDVTLFGLPLAEKGDRDNAISYISNQLNQHSWSQHLVTNIRIKFHNETSAIATAKLYNPQEAFFFFYITGGSYTHKLVKLADGTWKSHEMHLKATYLAPLVRLEGLALFIVSYVVLKLAARGQDKSIDKGKQD